MQRVCCREEKGLHFGTEEYSIFWEWVYFASQKADFQAEAWRGVTGVGRPSTLHVTFKPMPTSSATTEGQGGKLGAGRWSALPELFEFNAWAVTSSASLLCLDRFTCFSFTAGGKLMNNSNKANAFFFGKGIIDQYKSNVSCSVGIINSHSIRDIAKSIDFPNLNGIKTGS